MLFRSVPEYNLKTKYKKHITNISSIDWTIDEMYLRSADAKGDIIYWNLATMKQNKENDLKNNEWNSQTCKVGPNIEGIYSPETEKGSITEVAISKTDSILATGNYWGLINIYNYPCNKDTGCIRLR